MRMKQITAYDKQNKDYTPLSHCIVMFSSPCSHPHAPIPILPSQGSHPHISSLHSHHHDWNFLNLSCGVVMLLGWEHGDGSVDKALFPVILSPPSCPNAPNAVLCSHPHTPPCTLIPTIPAKIREMLYNSMLYERTFSVKLEDRKEYLVKKLLEERNR